MSFAELSTAAAEVLNFLDLTLCGLVHTFTNVSGTLPFSVMLSCIYHPKLRNLTNYSNLQYFVKVRLSLNFILGAKICTRDREDSVS
jgi:hypothetical protein